MTSHARNTASFSTLLQTHSNLDEMFLRHQEAVISKDLKQARDLLMEFIDDLTHHMVFEEEKLIPIYETVPPATGGGAELYIAEHAKLRAMLASIRDRLERIDARSAGVEREIIGLIEEEAAFKSLMNHHDLRERRFLYPKLDELTTEPERRNMIARHDENTSKLML